MSILNCYRRRRRRRYRRANFVACVRERSFNVAVHEINGTMNQKLKRIK